MKKHKKFINILLIILLIISAINYDRIATKIIQKLPESTNRYLAELYKPDKLWLHRVDSVNKQIELSPKYNGGGIEFDIIYHEKENAFENSHDIDSLAKYNLEEQFKTYDELGIHNGIWLDFKNLTQDNKFMAKQKLDELLQKYNISKDVIWLESGNWQALDIFKQDGYRTSYYLPYYKFENMSGSEIDKAQQDTLLAANSGNITAISFYGGYYDFVKSLPLSDNIVFLSWLNDSPWYEIVIRHKYQNILNDERVKVILIKDIGNYNR